MNPFVPHANINRLPAHVNDYLADRSWEEIAETIERDLWKLELTILRCWGKRPLWEIEERIAEGRAKPKSLKYIRCQNLVKKFEDSINKRWAIWKALRQKDPKKFCLLVSPKLLRFTKYLRERNEAL